MTSSRLQFHIDAQATGSKARAATFQTLHSEVKTPLFMPVGTQAAVKAQRFESLEDSGSQILLANTYHLLLRPGPEVFKHFGGYHGFTSWKRSVLTDSGGFQIFSLVDNLKMSEEGAAFRSHLDGKKFLLSPELSIDTQIAIGSDIMMALDQCIPSTAELAQAQEAMAITHRWAKRSLLARAESPQSLFGIVQGALFRDLRRQCAETLSEMAFDGFAIGGLAVGESKSEREDICEFTAELLPPDKPRYLMGVGTPIDILEAVHRGVDMFDCIIPTQVAQHGTVFTSRGIVHMRRSVHKMSDQALDPECGCNTCQRYSRGYLHHLLKAKEPMSWQLLGQHNIYFYHQLMREIRESILEDRFGELYRRKRTELHIPDMDNPVVTVSAKKKPSMQLGNYSVHQSGTEFSSIQHIESGEIMHSHIAPIAEAEELYVRQSGLVKMLSSHSDTVVVWDVGMGAAANAMATIAAVEKHASHCDDTAPIQLISFENDLDSLRLALRQNKHFPYLWHPAPKSLLEHGHWQSQTASGLQWNLVVGNFQEEFLSAEIALPDIIFFDMFSSKTNQAEWTYRAFHKLFAHCKDHATALYTYSSSTAVRAALLAAGFFVAPGQRTGAKAETTIAYTPARAEHIDPSSLLGPTWLQRWQRSTAKYPSDIEPSAEDEFGKRILQHPLFRGG